MGRERWRCTIRPSRSLDLEEQVAKLELILDTREYARDVMGLTLGSDYEKFYDSGGDAVMFNVSACRRDAFEPRQWTFPIVGTVPYLGFFNRPAANAMPRTEVRPSPYFSLVDKESAASPWYSIVAKTLENTEGRPTDDTV